MTVGWEETSQSFRQFVSGIGEFIDGVKLCQIEGVERMQPSMFWRDLRYEALYYVAPLMEKNEGKWAAVASKIVIVWVDGDGFEPALLEAESVFVYIVLSGVSAQGCLRVQVIKKDQNWRFGLCEDVLIVPKKIAPFVVKWTGILAQLAALEHSEPEPPAPSYWSEFPDSFNLPLEL
jgi:hypothetical protein